MPNREVGGRLAVRPTARKHGWSGMLRGATLLVTLSDAARAPSAAAPRSRLRKEMPIG
jgi:hypothetical protein